MKPYLSKANGHRGSTLLLTIIVTGLVGFLMAAYLTLVQNQNTTNFRSQLWNSSIALVEAGLEDALTHLNIHGSTNLACDGWQLFDGQYRMQRTLGDNYYIVAISNYPAAPTIYSYGFAELPTSAAVTPNTMLAAAGVPDTSKAFLGRGVRVALGRRSIYTKGILTKSKITVSGSVVTDSFDSTDPTASTNGLYDSAKARDNGDVASNATIEKAINTSGSIEVHGRAHTGPGGTVGFSGSAAIGSHAWHAAGNTGIQPGWSKNDMNVEFPDVAVPWTGGAFTPSGGTVGGEDYEYVLGSDNYQLTSMSLSGQKKVLVNGHAKLYLTGSLSMSGQSQLTIATNSSLTLYVGGSSGSLSGQGVVNLTSQATNFIYYGLPSNTSVSFSGGSAFVGIIYAPSAQLSLSGNSDISGATVTKEATLSGTFDFHYDEALSKLGGGGFVVSSWNEMTPDQMLPAGTLLGDYGQFYTPNGN